MCVTGYVSKASHRQKNKCVCFGGMGALGNESVMSPCQKKNRRVPPNRRAGRAVLLVKGKPVLRSNRELVSSLRLQPSRRMCCRPERQEIICYIPHSTSSTLAQECGCQVA